jgi:hypothetical protein
VNVRSRRTVFPKENAISCGIENVLVNRSGELWQVAQSFATGWVW